MTFKSKERRESFILTLGHKIFGEVIRMTELGGGLRIEN